MARSATLPHELAHPLSRVELPATIKRQYAGYLRKAVVSSSLIAGDGAVVVLSPIPIVACAKWLGFEQRGVLLSPLLVLPILFCLGLYSGRGPSPYERFRLRATAVGIYAALSLTVESIKGALSPNVLSIAATTLVLLTVGHYFDAIIRTWLIKARLWGASTLVLGSDERSVKAADVLMHRPEIGLRPIGLLTNPADGNQYSAGCPVPVLDAVAAEASCAEVIVSCRPLDLLGPFQGERAWMSSCRCFVFEDALDLPACGSRARNVGGALMWETGRDNYASASLLLKRAIDISVALPALILLCPLLAVVALVVKLVDGGPAFYTQIRVGRSGAKLRVFKFRTMFVDAEARLEAYLQSNPEAQEEWRRFFKLREDPRILPAVGHFLRASSLDELPQLWNVVRGDMSLVGPRPFPEYHLKHFDPEFLAARTQVMPGLTGMWQVSSRSDGDLQTQRAQDLFYIRNRSLLLDLYIMLQTLPAILLAKGAH
jgi:lipopolysaccharide/colanic/teichoic acid biosynthesis glycosyltransferase